MQSLATSMPSRPSPFAELSHAVLAHARTTPEALSGLMAAHPEHPRAHSLKALLLCCLGRAECFALAEDSAATARALGEGAQGVDKLYIGAASMAAEGHWQEAIAALEAILRIDADDALAAKLSHAFRFMLGDREGMLRSVSAVLSRMDRQNPFRSYLVGCQAFALEENGFYAAAETAGRMAVASAPDDFWALHAVSHVHEMTGRIGDGIRWIEAHQPRFGACNAFGGHLFWHLALFHLDLGDHARVLALYDGHIRREATDDFRDIANAVSLLARLEQDGCAVGQRWEELADLAETRMSDRSLLFADLHYLLALIGGAREDATRRFARALAEGGARFPFQRDATAVGAEIALGLHAFAEGNMDEAFTRLRASQKEMGMLGGSHAQRDIFMRFLIEAGLASRDPAPARRMLVERLTARNGQDRFARLRLPSRAEHKVRAHPALLASCALAMG